MLTMTSIIAMMTIDHHDADNDDAGGKRRCRAQTRLGVVKAAKMAVWVLSLSWQPSSLWWWQPLSGSSSSSGIAAQQWLSPRPGHQSCCPGNHIILIIIIKGILIIIMAYQHIPPAGTMSRWWRVGTWQSGIPTMYNSVIFYKDDHFEEKLYFN